MPFSESISSNENQETSGAAALQSNDQLLKAVFNSTAIGLVVVDEAGMFVEVNDSICSMFGYERNELIGKPHTILHVEEEKELAIQNHLAFFNGPANQGDKDWRGVTKNKQEIIISYRTNLFVQDNGQRFTVKSIRDVTDLKEAERALAITQLEYKTLFEQHPDAVVSFELSGKFASVNDAAMELAEASRDQLLENDFLRYIDPDKANEIITYFHAVKKGETQRFETVIVTGTNKRKSVSVILMPIFIHNEVTGLYCVLKDVTLEKRYKQELEFQSHLLDTIQQSVIVTKPDGTIIFWNSFAEKLYGWRKDDVVGVNIMQVTPSEMSIEQAEKIMTRLSKGESWSGEFLVKHKTNGTFTAQIVNSPVIDTNGKLTGIIGVSWDITERKQYEQQKELDRLDKEALINTTSDLIWSVSSDYKLIAANKAFIDSLKISVDLFIKPGDDILIPSLFAEEIVLFWRDHYARALAGESFTIELHTAAKGPVKEHWDEIIFNPIFKNEQVIGVACRSRDISQPKQYQAKLLSINNQLETAQQIAKLGYWVLDLKSEELFWSNEVYTIFGIEQTAFGANYNAFFERIHPDDQANFQEQQDRSLKGESLLNFEHRIVLPDQSIKYVSERGTLVHDEAGTAIRFEGTVQDITERKLAELALKLNEEQLNLIYNSTAGIIFLLGIENENTFRFISMNKAGLAAIGLPEEAVFGKYVQEVIPEPSLSVVLEKYKEAIVTKQSVVWQETSAYPTETKVGVVTVTPIFDNEGNCIRLVGSVNDITELKKIEQSLAISQQEYKSLFDQNPDAVYSLDLQGHFISFNEGLENLLECNREVLFQQETFVPYCHPDDLERTKQYFQKVLQGDSLTYEVNAITQKGNNRYLSISNMPIIVDGVITGVYGIAKNITTEKLVLQELEQSNERYELATKATNDVIWDWDLEHNKVLRAGSGFTAMFGYDELKANNNDRFWSEKIHPADIERVVTARQLVFDNNEQNFWEDEYRFFRTDGTIAYIYDRAYIVRNAQGKAVRMIGATKDITVQKESELQLKELFTELEQRATELEVSNKELERFAYIASHDLQEPLRMVNSFLQLLQKKYSDSIDEKGQEYIRFAVDGSVRMKRLINDLLDYSRTTTRKQQLESVDMQVVMKEVLQNLSLQIREKQATVEVSGMPVLTWADQTQMVQLLQNLVGNALKYSTENPPLVEISAEEGADEWLFTVKDNGIGFDQKFAEKIFVIFQRLHNKVEYSGTGIGLAICKKIVDRHGGSIRVESEPGKGSMFYFTISKHLVAEKPIFSYERS